MSDLSEALDVAGNNDLGAALEASRGIDLAVQSIHETRMEYNGNQSW